MQLKPLDGAVPQASVASQHPGMIQGLQDNEALQLAEAACLNLSPTASKRFRRELAWLKAVPGVSKSAATILAAHAVGGIMTVRPQVYDASTANSVFTRLASVLPDRTAVESAAATLIPASKEGGPLLAAKDMACINALWPLTAPTEALLASGGDDRLTLDPVTGLNRYGCAPWPRPDIISFGSCTASSLSEGAFAAAERARRALAASALATSPATALAEASEAIGTALLQHFGVEDLAEAVLAASGTDAALVVTGLLAAEHPGEGLTSILVSPSETGSGVPDAVQGRHFASCAPSGSVVGKGQPIDGLSASPSLVTVALRDGKGAPRAPAEIDAELKGAIRVGLDAGRVVLHAMDGSKTGLTAPDRDACRKLVHSYGSKLDIVIDACQARIEPALVRWYLQQGFPVLVTGSKFFSAPGFCGAVLFPRLRLQRITRAGRLPAGLAAYARLQGGFGSRRCPGLVLRWTAALHEMAIFRQVPVSLVAATLSRLGQAIETGISADERLQLLNAPRPTGMGWSERRSVFTFGVNSSAGPMSAGDLRTLYRALSEYCSDPGPDGDVLCQVGQPVELGTSGFGGLRIAISAAQLTSDEDQVERLKVVLRKLRHLLNHSTRL